MAWTDDNRELVAGEDIPAGPDRMETMNPLLLAMLLLADPAPAAAPAAGATVAPAPGGWRSARFGMTPAEVVAALPGEATRLSPPVTLADGNTVDVGIDGYRFEGLSFDVRFVFAGGKLALVSLRTPPKTYVDVTSYARLRDTLVKQWGPPLEDTKDDSFIDMRQTRWNRGPDRADLKYIPGVVAILHYPGPAGQ
jgi:hypothetical protein